MWLRDDIMCRPVLRLLGVGSQLVRGTPTSSVQLSSFHGSDDEDDEDGGGEGEDAWAMVSLTGEGLRAEMGSSSTALRQLRGQLQGQIQGQLQVGGAAVRCRDR